MRTLRILLLIVICYVSGAVMCDLLVPWVSASRNVANDPDLSAYTEQTAATEAPPRSEDGEGVRG